ncbi:hypothetical protein OUZ56_024428 [Daphnia magna]|uniref:Uncharacterized protein n=1 Tax=Daphnia magna TaxID=35525 RepID=A0ABR0B0U0_9CRUS|nr:hypothetical protein OUZ56_024428 [Daphnia magna]
MEAISETREIVARANNMANFLERVDTLRSELSGRESKYFKTTSGSQRELYLALGGVRLKQPLRSCTTVGCSPILCPSIGSKVDESMERAVLTVLYEELELAISVRNCRMNVKEEDMGLEPRSWFQLTQCFQADWSIVSFEKPLVSNRFLIHTTRLEGNSSTELMGVVPVLASVAKDDAELEHEEFRGETKVEITREGTLEQDLLYLSLSWLRSEELVRTGEKRSRETPSNSTRKP